jgi:hypothetical protein
MRPSIRIFGGVEVCFDHNCAEMIANALLLDGAEPIAAALKSLAGGGSFSSIASAANLAWQAGGGVIGLVIVGLSVYTTLSIRANNTAAGCMSPVVMANHGRLHLVGGGSLSIPVRDPADATDRACQHPALTELGWKAAPSATKGCRTNRVDEGVGIKELRAAQA